MELEEEVVWERRLKGASSDSEPSSLTYAPALEEEVALGRGNSDEVDRGRDTGP
jgi:hypothetical protein